MRTRPTSPTLSRAVALLLALGIFLGAGAVIAQSRLVLGGSASNFGRSPLAGGFMPDPFTTSITSGGEIDASTLGLGPGCGGFVTAQPDYILDYTNPRSFLRLYFVAQGNGDTTLLINDGAGHWHCNDDSNGGLNPMVDLNRPSAGQYDIWIGSYRANENVRGTLHITEMRSRHP